MLLVEICDELISNVPTTVLYEIRTNEQYITGLGPMKRLEVELISETNSKII